jgi:hypothetical protein
MRNRYHRQNDQVPQQVVPTFPGQDGTQGALHFLAQLKEFVLPFQIPAPRSLKTWVYPVFRTQFGTGLTILAGKFSMRFHYFSGINQAEKNLQCPLE